MADLIETLNVECGDCDLLESGLTPDCNDRVPGGNDIDIYITNTCDIESWEDSYTDGIIDSITMKSGKVWYLVKANPDSVTFSQPVNAQRGFITFNFSMQITSIAEAGTKEAGAALVNDFINVITNPYNKFTVVITDNAGVKRIIGLNKLGVKVADGTQYDSGAAFADFAGWTVNFSGVDTRVARVLADGIVLPLV